MSESRVMVVHVVKGFTLLEVTIALMLLSMLAAYCYATLIPAAHGFKILQEHRDALLQSFDVSRQLRQDISFLAQSSQKHVRSVRVSNDNRGNTSFDSCWLLVREAGRSTLSLVHYFVDESGERAVLVREEKIPFARDFAAKPMQWKIAYVESFDISVMNRAQQWVETLADGQLPKALRIRWRDERGDREWTMPVFLE